MVSTSRAVFTDDPINQFCIFYNIVQRLTNLISMCLPVSQATDGHLASCRGHSDFIVEEIFKQFALQQ